MAHGESASPKSWADFDIVIPAGATGEIDTLCPRCSHNRKKSRVKCLSVNTEKGVWECKHCGWKGSLGTARTNHNGGPHYGAPLQAPERRPSKVFVKPPLPPEQAVTPEVQRWFARRGIALSVVERARISSGREFCPQFGHATQAIRFPYFRDGQLINIKYRANPKAFWMRRGAERILYGLDDIAGAETIIIVEGELDKLSVDQAEGWPCVSVPDGAPAVDASNYASKFDFLDGVAAERFSAARTVIIATDMDAPGVKLADELARRIGYARCRRARWPQGCKDANETLVNLGPQAVQETLADAQPYPIAGIVTIRELYSELDDLYEHGYDEGRDLDWPTFDDYYRVRPGLVTITTGSPGAGKSHLIDNIVTRLACRHGWTFAICSPENQPLKRHAAGLIAVYQGLPFTDGPTPRMSRAQMHEARAWANDHFIFVLPDPPTIENILERAEALVQRNGISGLVIDPWNELSHNRPPGMSVTDFASEFLSRLRNFARHWQVHVWLVAHPTKLQKTNEGKYPIPTPYDIADCYSDDTEVLTRHGWRHHSDIAVGDQVLCFDLESGTTRWGGVEHRLEQDYEGEMCHFTGRNLDLLVTPNHRLAVKPQWHHQPANPADPRIRPRAWQFVEAGALSGSPWLVPLAATLADDGDAAGDRPQEMAMMPLDAGYAMDDFLRFLGWFIAEGSVSMGAPVLCQAQGPLAEEMAQTCKTLGLDITESLRADPRGHQPVWKARVKVRANPDFAHWFTAEYRQGARHKHLPDFTWSLSARQKEILLDALLQGDGYRGKRGTYQYTTTSPHLADDVQRLVIELGRSAKLGRRVGAKPHHADQLTVYIGQRGKTERDISARRHLRRIPYKGKIWCLTVPTGAYVTRRNGVVSFHGNSAHFYNKADTCLSVWRNMADQTQPAQVHVQKVRFAETGQLGMVEFLYDGATGRFYEVGASPTRAHPAPPRQRPFAPLDSPHVVDSPASRANDPLHVFPLTAQPSPPKRSDAPFSNGPLPSQQRAPWETED